jgi:predicted enzyme related to lactoylglutathione lyase
MSRPPGMPEAAPDSWAVYFLVSDIAVTVAAVQQSGGELCFGPQQLDGIGITIAMVSHPTGGFFSLMQPPG